MKPDERAVDYQLCPVCKGRGMVRVPGEWSNETCASCDGRGEVPVAEPAETKT